MGDIGENQREIEIEPIDIPAQPPIEAPAERGTGGIDRRRGQLR